VFGNDRDKLRRQYLQAWSLHTQGQALDPLQAQITQVLIDHPEYQTLVESEDALEREYLPEFGETNPFLHMGLHLAVRDQVKTNRPDGIQGVFQQLLIEHQGDAHAAEHVMIDCLAESLWQAQRAMSSPDETAYLECVNRRTHSGKKK
jgi:hypothetical protein